MPPLAGPHCNMEQVEEVLASMEALVKTGKFAEVGGVQGHEKPHRAVLHAINAQRSAKLPQQTETQ